jgi:hypothetical protein
MRYIKYVVLRDGIKYDSFDELAKAIFVRDKYQYKLSESHWVVVKQEIKETELEA